MTVNPHCISLLNDCCASVGICGKMRAAEPPQKGRYNLPPLGGGKTILPPSADDPQPRHAEHPEVKGAQECEDEPQQDRPNGGTA